MKNGIHGNNLKTYKTKNLLQNMKRIEKTMRKTEAKQVTQHQIQNEVLDAIWHVGVPDAMMVAEPTKRIKVATKLVMIIVIWVDDVICASANDTVRDKFAADLAVKFTIEEKSELTWVYLSVGHTCEAYAGRPSVGAVAGVICEGHAAPLRATLGYDDAEF
jgi:hypothetical protein